VNLISPDLASVPGAKVVFNSLYDSKDPGCLTQDLLLVTLPTKMFVDVSWFPEHDPSGTYVVSVFRGGQQIREVDAKSAFDAVKLVGQLAYEFSKDIGNVSASTSMEIESRIDYCAAWLYAKARLHPLC
jgi:hypothetical protein